MIRPVRAIAAAVMRSPARHVFRPIILTVDGVLMRVTGGRLKLSAPIIPSLVLHSTGAKSGLARETALMCLPRPGGWYVAGSNFGRPEHPAWSANLIAHPDARVHYRRELVDVRARLLSQDEADAVWPLLDDQWPGYRDYEKTAKHSIRVFALDTIVSGDRRE